MMMIATHSDPIPIVLGASPWSLPSTPGSLGSPSPKVTGQAEADEPDDTFARLAKLVASNDRLLAELKALDAKLARADAYADDPASNPALARAYRDRQHDRRARVLVLLRVNRISAREFLAS